MAVRLSAPDFAWPLMAHDHVLSHVSQLGLDGIDVGLFEGRSHIEPSDVLSNPQRNGATLAERLARHSLELSDLFLVPALSLDALAPNHPDRAVQAESRAIFGRALEYATSAGALGVTINPGVLYPDESPSASIERSAAELRRRVGMAAEAGLRLSVEGGLGTNTQTPAQLLELVDATPGLGVTLDLAHFVYQGINEREADPLLRHCRHLHCRGAKPGSMQTTFRENAIDYERVVRDLWEHGFDGYICIEYVWVEIWECFRTENTMETIRFRDWLRTCAAARRP